MIDSLFDFFRMGGYGIYVFSAYGMVLGYLLLQWLLAYRMKTKNE